MTVAAARARPLSAGRRLLVTGSIGLLAFSCVGPGSSTPRPADGGDWAAVEQRAVALLADYLKTDTTNPPGNETRAARFLKAIFDAEGIEARIVESAPDRGNLYARLKGDGSGPAVVLLNHLDVVPADRRAWSVDPFGGVVKDGHVWGRGALDMKGLAVIQLMSMVLLKRHGVALKSDVRFLGVADEELGGRMGAGFIVREHPDLVRGAGVVLNEGGSIFRGLGGRWYVSIVPSEKVPLPITLTATGPAGHGSTPRPEAAVPRLIAALNRVAAHQTPIKVVPEVQRFYAAIADFEPSPWRERLRDLAASLRDPAVAAEFSRSATANARVRNTIAITMLEGSSKQNVVPSRATARLDVRLLPGEDPSAFVEELRRVIADDGVTIETVPARLSGTSPLDHRLFAIVTEVMTKADPRTVVTTPLGTGANDCRYFRPLGIPCYGFMPFRLSPGEGAGFHGNDERLSVENIGFGLRVLYEVVRRLATE